MKLTEVVTKMMDDLSDLLLQAWHARWSPELGISPSQFTFSPVSQVEELLLATGRGGWWCINASKMVAFSISFIMARVESSSRKLDHIFGPAGKGAGTDISIGPPLCWNSFSTAYVIEHWCTTPGGLKLEPNHHTYVHRDAHENSSTQRREEQYGLEIRIFLERSSTRQVHPHTCREKRMGYVYSESEPKGFVNRIKVLSSPSSSISYDPALVRSASANPSYFQD
jgi:hypothetical protein